MRELAPGVWFGAGTHVNFLALVDGADVTLIDAGWAGDVDRVEAELASIGRRPQDVRAILVTHAHIDHVGGIAKLHERYGTPVLVHPDELAHARGEAHEQAAPLDLIPAMWRPRTWKWMADVARVGVLGHVEMPYAEPFMVRAAGAPLDLPGAPVPVACAGHTSGHTAFLLPGGIVATGDALATGHPLSGTTGPQLLPAFFSHDPAATAAALDTIAVLDADQLAPGHGEPWRGDPAQAVELARATYR
ncbi:MBL fold metallo-hydrolase [Tsukamurella ocularis]|uniref:MBL fold metallo-hydrolase n=1 Tax=Tsukamurella ocularis TaxID=1970234 RepID=UPI00216700CC|nr:MBL fold metallo-hydrolase [Tsukamurella ocularis]MCS3780581.1 glyoxylase-like metal-dependent hydrolase (beta-lactamase superfamily II) [Tsukamurella ocularis]MCS3785864.1 glyoxylase-like metal-dependent hydrolase (beta-lactamase superfamily II) [Tsukamurella ocularis]MCS3849228.1 glyoxylase-like metal-dependent hydrolase (beta-lactamase superfamily II) [Tsukamurella ocularis]